MSEVWDLTGGAGCQSIRGMGWALPEAPGLWNNGVQTSLEISGLDLSKKYSCQMFAIPHIAKPHVPEQRVLVSGRGGELFEGRLTEPGSFEFPLTSDADGVARLYMRFPDARSPHSLGVSTDSRGLALLLQRIALTPIEGESAGVAAQQTRPKVEQTGCNDIIFMQTADAVVYKSMLDLAAKVNILYCKRHGIRYESYVGIKKGAAPWQATYNRIFMLHELVERGFGGWVAFIDADAFVVDLDFDLRKYLDSNSNYCLIGAGGGTDDPWNLNAGVLFINLGDSDGRMFVNDWLERFNVVVPEAFLADPEAKWEDHLNDQALMYDSIRQNPGVLSKTKQERRGLFNYGDASFIRQAMRVGFPTLESRMRWIREQTRGLVGAEATGMPYVNLDQLANRYGSDKGSQVRDRHGYTSFYQFLFDGFRLDAFSFLELGLLCGGDQENAERVAHEVPSVKMWLDYFPNAFCHGVDISDFSLARLERFRFHRGDIGSQEDLKHLLGELPRLRFAVDDASHASYHQQIAFAKLFDLVEAGGYYVIEDLHYQPPQLEAALPRCRLTRDVMLSFAASRILDLPFLSTTECEVLASHIGRIHLLRRPEDGLVKLVALQKIA